MAIVCAVLSALGQRADRVSEMFAENSGRYNALMRATEALALHRVAFYLNTCQNIKSLLHGTAATSRSSIRNIHGTTLGNLMAATKCRHQPPRFIWAIQTWLIQKKRSWHRFRVATC